MSISRRITSWIILAMGGATILWLVLSFVIYLPVDESKVYPPIVQSRLSGWVILWHSKTAPSTSTSDPKVGQKSEEHEIQLISPSTREWFFLPALDAAEQFGYHHRTGTAFGPPQKIHLGHFSDTRRYIIRSIEKQGESIDPEIPRMLTRDPFALTRIFIFQTLDRLNKQLVNWIG